MRKLGTLICAVILLMGLGGASSAALTNGGFDTGDFTGWTVLDSDGNVDVVESATILHTSPVQSYSPKDGSYFAEINMFGTTFGGFDYIRQIVHLNAGDTLSGFAAYVSGDNSGIDPLYAKVRILNAVSTSVAEIANPWSFSGSSADSGWQPWSWTAPQTDFYTLSLELNTGEIATDVYAFFDANAVSPAVVSVPIPGSLMLLGSGLAGLGLLRRKWGLKV